MSLRERLSRPGLIVLDGAVGTELARRGVDTSLPLWSARAYFDEHGLSRLIGLHRDYAAAGADILVTNTFRTTPRTLRACGVENLWALWNRRAVEAAREGARARPGTLVAGSLAPLEDCYRPDRVPPQADLLREHLVQADLLARLGVDLLLIETMNCRREALAAIQAARAVGLDFIVSLCPGQPGEMLSGEPLSETLPRLLEAGGGPMLGVLLNCATPAVLSDCHDTLIRLAGGLPHGLYAHLGEPDPDTGWRLPRDQDPEAYADWMRGRIARGARLVGGCCGTGPAHIAALARLAHEQGC